MQRTLEHAFKAALGCAVIVQILQCVAHNPIGDRNNAGIAGAGCDAREAFRNGLRRTAFAGVEVQGPQRPKCTHLRVQIIQALRDFERGG